MTHKDSIRSRCGHANANTNEVANYNNAIATNQFVLTIDDEVHAVQALWLFVGAHFVDVGV